MRYTTRNLLLVVGALAAAALTLTTSTDGRGSAAPTLQGERVIIRMGAELRPDSFEAQVRSGEVIGMTATKKGGGRVALKLQSTPPCSTNCPSDRKLTCWADESQVTNICVCGTGDDAEAPIAPKRKTIRATREVILAGGA